MAQPTFNSVDVVYHGRITKVPGTNSLEPQVIVDRPGHIAPLPIRRELGRSHGHNWGYTGAGPGQLAFDLLMDISGGDKVLSRRYYPFLDRRLGLRFRQDEPWDLTGAELIALIEQITLEEHLDPLDTTSQEYKDLSW